MNATKFEKKYPDFKLLSNVKTKWDLDVDFFWPSQNIGTLLCSKLGKRRSSYVMLVNIANFATISYACSQLARD